MEEEEGRERWEELGGKGAYEGYGMLFEEREYCKD